jgi:general secretion pathway protein G
MKTQEKAKMKHYNEWTEWAISITANKLAWLSINKRGMTLIELIVVCTILGVLATMALPIYSDIKEKAKVAKGETEIRGLEKEIYAYNLDNGFYPSGLVKIGKDKQNDPWGRPYVYNLIPADLSGAYTDWTGTSLNTDFDLYSEGKDGNTNLMADPTSRDTSYDDIVRASNGGFVVLVEKY